MKPYCYGKYPNDVCAHCGFRRDCFRITMRKVDSNTYWKVAEKEGIYDETNRYR